MNSSAQPSPGLSSPALVVIIRSLSSLRLDPRNARKHSPTQIKQVAKSIRSFGFNVPIQIDKDGNILAGAGRFLACQILGWQEIPTIQLEHMTKQQARAFAIADNRLTENSTWDENILAETFKELKAGDLNFDIEDTGFTLDEIDLRIEGLNINSDEKPDPDDQLPESAGDPVVSKMGDLWLMGGSRLLHGDATKLPDIELLMNGERAAMTFCDPPYGVDYANSAKDKLRGTHRPILNDNLGENFGDFLFAACSHFISVTDGAIYVCMSSSALHVLQCAFEKAGGHWSTFIIWAKQAFTLGRADYQRQYEPILYGWREGSERHWCGARDQGDVWFINRPVKNDLHPTMKPVELVMRALRNSSKRGDIILDPFLGSGSSLIAAERTGRICYGMELDGQYVDIAIRRWQRHTGERAIHATADKSFDDMAATKEVRHDLG